MYRHVYDSDTCSRPAAEEHSINRPKWQGNSGSKARGQLHKQATIFMGRAETEIHQTVHKSDFMQMCVNRK